MGGKITSIKLSLHWNQNKKKNNVEESMVRDIEHITGKTNKTNIMKKSIKYRGNYRYER